MTIFRKVSGPLTLFAGDPRTIYFPITDADGAPQLLTGRTFRFVIRRDALVTAAIIDRPTILALDGMSAVATLTGAQTLALATEHAGYALAYDLIEMVGDDGVTRWSGRIALAPGSGAGSDDEPAWLDLDGAAVVAAADVREISERGAVNPIEQRLKDLGETEEATPEAMVAWMQGQGAAGAAPFAEAAETSADAAASSAVFALASADTASDEADRSEVAAGLSEAARDAALSVDAGLPRFASISAGLAGTSNGDEFVVLSTDDPAIGYYRNDSGTATLLASITASALTSALVAAIDVDPIGAMAVDPDGLGIGGVLEDGTLIGALLQLAGLKIIPTDDGHLTIVDPDDLVSWTSDPAYTRTLTVGEGAAIDAVVETVGVAGDGVAAVDPDGLADMHADAGGLTVSGPTLTFGEVTMSAGESDRLRLIDTDGLIIFDSSDIEAIGDSASSDAAYAARDAANVAYAMAGQNDLMPMVQGIERGKVNIFLTYGQSLRRASRGYPPLTTAVPSYSDAYVFSLGQANRPADDDDPTYAPVTSGDLYPLLAVSHNNAGAILDHAALEALGPDTAVPGESISISATYWLRQQYLAKHNLTEDPDTPFIVLDCAVGGKSVSELSKGASPEYYARLLSGLTQIRDHPDFAGKEFVLPLIDFGQGEEDYSDGAGGVDPDVASYQAAVVALMDDIYADILDIFENDQKRPAIFIAQAGGAFTTDATNLHVGQAQLNLVTQVDGYFPTGPNYPVVNVASAHPDNNGYRWLGQYCGRAWASVLIHGRRPNIVYPRRATWEAATNEVIIDFVSTGGAISEGNPYGGFTAQTVTSLGISAKYGSTVYSLTDVRLVGAMTVAATLATTPPGAPLVQLGTKALDNGYIGLRCASRQVSPEVYTFIENAGQDPAADIPALVGEPYDLSDWCWAASIQAEEI